MQRGLPLLGVLLAGLLLLTAASLVVVSTSPGLSGLVASPSPTVSPPIPSPLQPSSSLNSFSSWDGVTAFLESSSSYGGYGPYGQMFRTLGAPAPMMESASSDAKTSGGSTSYSSTNVQVAGVDEADILKNDGTYLYTITQGTIAILQAYPASEARLLSTIAGNDTHSIQFTQLFVSGDRLVAFGTQGFNWMPIIKESGLPTPSTVEGDETSPPSKPIANPGIASDSVVARSPLLPPYPWSGSSSFAIVYDISNRSSPQLLTTIDAQGHYLSSRMIGSRVYMVFNEFASAGIPRPLYAVDGRLASLSPSEVYYIDEPFESYTFTTVVGFDVNNLDQPLSQKVILTSGGQTVFSSADNLYLSYTKYNYYWPRWQDYAPIVEPLLDQSSKGRLQAIDASDASDWQKDSLRVRVAEQFLSSLDPRASEPLYRTIAERQAFAQSAAESTREQTVIHKFSLGPSIAYIGKGVVPGALLNQFSMDESNGFLRVATTLSEVFRTHIRVLGGPAQVGLPPSPQAEATEESASDAETSDDAIAKGEPVPPGIPPSPSIPSTTNVYVLDSSMQVVGGLEGLAPGERMYSARFIGSRAYLVTFKQIDPLFAIDLSDPARPTLLGELKIPGYSSYLHPYDETHLIGLGRDVIVGNEGYGEVAFPLGLKLSLFDVSNVNDLKEVANFTLGDAGTYSPALDDHKAFLFDLQRNLLVIPVQLSIIDRSKNPGPQVIHVYGEPVFQGAYVFTVSSQAGFSVRGRISHSNASSDEFKRGFDWLSDVQRSAYINDVLYTVSPRFVKANELQSLSPLASVELPVRYPYPPFAYEEIVE